MRAEAGRVVLCGGARTPIGHFARSLSGLRAEELLVLALDAALAKTGVKKESVDGLIAGCVGQSFSAPNVARVAALKAGLSERTQAITVQNNCVSSIESVAAAARMIVAGEGELFVAAGTECMSRLPYTIDGTRAAKPLRSMAVVRERWAELPGNADVSVVDSIEQGLTDPIRRINMAGAAEVSAQTHGIGRREQDDYARESFRRSIAGWKNGFYGTHVVPAAGLDKDEYPFLREDLPEKPQLMAKAAPFYDNPAYSIKDFYRDQGGNIRGREFQDGAGGTVTLFNSCGRSDGAAAVIVASERRARDLGLDVMAELKGWGFTGDDPAHMGTAPALAAPIALERSGVSFESLDLVELHEPFAATVLSIFKLGREKFGHDWAGLYAANKLNPHGGSLALGHPLGATGARLLLNLLHGLRRDSGARLGMIAACAQGGVGGAMVVERA